MNSAANRKKAGSIALVVDEKLSRDRRGILSRIVAALRQFADVQLLNGEIAEVDLLEKLQAGRFSLVLAPWYLYLKWSKVEAFFGLTRVNGATFAGYFAEPIDPHEVGAQAGHLRTILLDFADTQPHEAAVLVHSLLLDSRRTGIRPLLDAAAPIYCENWQQGQGQGMRIDAVLGLPEITQNEWLPRAPALRIILNALWSLVYEEGPGKHDLTQPAGAAKTPRAYLQLGCDAKLLALRLWYVSPGSSAKNALASFWPDPTRPFSAAQLLLRSADFLRIHTLSDGQDVEVTAGLFKSAPSEKAHRRLHAFWVEPVSPNLVTEVPYEAPGPNASHLRALPSVGPADARMRPTGIENDEKAKERFIFEAAVKLRELKKQLNERDELIRDLKSGGVGTAAPLPPPDAESLIEAFQQKYFEARFQIRQFELQIAEMERKGATPQEVEALRQKMAALASREETWIRSLAGTLQDYRAARKSSGGGS